MRFTSALVLLSAPLLALSRVIIKYTSYSRGLLYLAIDTYTDAPSSVNVVAIDSSRNLYNFATGASTTGSGHLRVVLPASTRPGSYRVHLVDPATGKTLSTSESFTVRESDLEVISSLSLQSASYTYSVTGSIIPFVTPTPYFNKIYWSVQTRYGRYSDPTPAGSIEPVSSVSATSVLPSSALAVTTDSVVTGSRGTSTVSVTQTITGSVLSSSGAATASLLTASTATQNAELNNEPQLHLAPPIHI